MKNLKTTTLLNKVNEDDLDDETFDEALGEINARIPFVDLGVRFSEIEKLLEDQEKEIQKLRNNMRSHTHLPSGKSVKEI